MKIFLLLCLIFPLSASAISNKWPKKSWEAAVEGEIQKNLGTLSGAADRNYVCPGYDGATEKQKVKCWSLLLRAVASLESADNPKDVSHEDGGKNSVGLLQLSRGECKSAPTEESLKDPHKNLACGVKELAFRIKRFGKVEGKKGAGSYWSVLRKPYTYTIRKGKYRGRVVKLGKIDKIIMVSKQFKTAPN